MTYAKLLNVTPARYHQDPCERPSLSKSIAQVLLDKSPMHARYLHPRLGGASYEATDTQNRGSIIHRLLLGKGAEIAIINADDYRTNAAKAERDAALANGQIPIKAKDYTPLATAAEAIRTQLLNCGFDLNAPGSVVEEAIEWDEEGQVGPVRCRAMFDWVHCDDGAILDVKSIDDASPSSCARSMYRYGYAMQAAAYQSALSALTGEPSRFTFLFCELDPPYGVLPAVCSGAFAEIGKVMWKRAVRIWEQCLLNNDWPGYSTGIVRIEPPGWALSQLTENEL